MSQLIKIGILLAFYFLLFMVIRLNKRKVEPGERKTFLVLYLLWSTSMFIANYVGYLLGIMSYLPWWPNNFLHTFVWIGICLTFLYLAIRHQPMHMQVIAFVVFSLIVKYAEQKIFGVWEMEHFLYIFKGNDAYIIGWSLVDGLYPPLSFLILKLLSKRLKGLEVVAPKKPMKIRAEVAF